MNFPAKTLIISTIATVIFSALLSWHLTRDRLTSETIMPAVESSIDGKTSPGRIGNPLIPSSNTLNPFAALDCTSPAGLLKNKVLCSPDELEIVIKNEDEPALESILRNAVDSLHSSNPIDRIIEINASFTACAYVNRGQTIGTRFGFDSDTIEGCEPQTLVEMTLATEAKLFNMKRSPEVDEAIFSWLYTRQSLLQSDAEIAMKNSQGASALANEPVVAEYKAARMRTRTFLESMTQRDESHETTLALFLYEDELPD